MTIQQALDIFKKSEYGKKYDLVYYVEHKSGYILIPKGDFVSIPGAPNFLVSSDGKLHPISPVAVSYTANDLKKL